MLAEPRQKRSYLLTPRGQPLYEDENRFGSRMLEKMGWSKGKGLGVNEDGTQDFVRLRYKQDSKGLGFQDRDDQWTQHEDSFDGLLKSLNDGNLNCEKMCEIEIPKINSVFQGNRESMETAADTSKKFKEKTSGMSLEERSRKSKVRVHYKKFTKGKDLTQYSEKDLANIFGKTFTEEKKVTNQGDIKTPSLVDNYFTSKEIVYEINPFNTAPNQEIIEDNINKENMRKKKVKKESARLSKEKEILKSKDKKKLVSDNVADNSEAFKALAVKTSTSMIDEDSSRPSSKKKSVKPVSKLSDTEADNSNLTKICIEAAATDITRVKRKKTAIGIQGADKAVKKKPSKREGHAVHEGVENNADTRKVHVLDDVGNELEMENSDPSTASSKKKLAQPISKSNDRETDDSNLTKGSIEDVATDITRAKKKRKSSKRKVHVGDEAVEIHALSDVRDDLQVFKQFGAEKSVLAADVDSPKPLPKKKTVKSAIKSSDGEADSSNLTKIDIEAVPTETSRLKRKNAAIGCPETDKVAKKKTNKRKRDAIHETVEDDADTRKVRVLDNIGNELEMFKQFDSKNCVLTDDAGSSKASSKKELVNPVIKSNDIETGDSNLTKVDLETIPADINRVKRKAKGVHESNKAGKKKDHAVGEIVENNADTGEVRAVNEDIVDTWTSPTEEGCNKTKNKEKNPKKQKKELLVENEENGNPSKSQHQSESEINLDSLIVQNCAANTCLDESEKLSFKPSSLKSLRLKYEKSNYYEISSFCAEKFRNADIQKFPGSSLSQVEGYSLNADTILDVQDKRNDEERITNLWKCTLDKYNQLEKPKKTYQGYVKQVIQAKIHKQKRPKLYTKSWKRKSAFQPI